MWARMLGSSHRSENPAAWLAFDWRENEDRVWVGGWWYLLKNGRWQTVGDVRRIDYEFAGFTNPEDLKTLAEAYYGKDV